MTIDKSGANKAGIDKINLLLVLLFLFTRFVYQIFVRQNKYLNNIVEQDHRGIKCIIKSLLEFKSFASAKATIAGIELHHMLKKGQHKSAVNLPVFEQFYAFAA